jgi:maleylacetoacetate isomerase
MKLYGYWRSSAAYRVRIALALKNLSYEYLSINLATGAHRMPEYGEVNPQQLVPVLMEGDEPQYQSLAIIDYLEETHPHPPLLPRDPLERSRVRSLAMIIACEIHPLNNPRVLNYITGQLGATEEQKLAWYAHWVSDGFSALERRLATERWTGRYCHGDTPGMADACLVPQVANAVRFKVDLAPFPTICRINETCLEHEAFRKAAPENQPDAVKS